MLNQFSVDIYQPNKWNHIAVCIFDSVYIKAHTKNHFCNGNTLVWPSEGKDIFSQDKSRNMLIQQIPDLNSYVSDESRRIIAFQRLWLSEYVNLHDASMPTLL